MDWILVRFLSRVALLGSISERSGGTPWKFGVSLNLLIPFALKILSEGRDNTFSITHHISGIAMMTLMATAISIA
jgi:hypothetical protein